ncbi:n-acetylglutamate synthase [Galbibacter mesophilus]|uniref:n-acetylglutamate synthase n=1 Tax=Galbibacter mesophilus TaxID=379069 RepID=UPI00191DD8D2|nr:n-acetylglutamate synthase [Galbibacter mesophilus]MCM5661592.1 n-acetylglutamate synthase [Galbibacter mesophilus]
MRINYDNKAFKPVANTENGQTSQETIFKYKQEGQMVSANYGGGEIAKGHLLGLVDKDGVITMCYHQIDIHGNLRTGKCTSVPEIIENNKIRLHETWEWTSGDFSKGTSIIEEI